MKPHHDIEGASDWQGSRYLMRGNKGSLIIKSNNDGKIDKDFQAGVINAISSTSSHQISFITSEI